MLSTKISCMQLLQTSIRPTAIYYGADIAPINRKMLHMIAKEKGIKEYQMYIDNRSYNYSMRFRMYNA